MNSLFGYFDKTLILNLPERSDRRLALNKEFNFLGISLTKNKIEFFEGHKPSQWDGWPTQGAKGSLISHMNLLKKALSDGCEKIIMLEDDLTLTSNFEEVSEWLVPKLETFEWDVLMGGTCNMKECKTSYAISEISHTDATIGSHFVMYKKSFFEPFVEYLDLVRQRESGHVEGGAMYYDAAFNMFRMRNPHLKTKVVNPYLGYQRSSRSDITPKLIDRLTCLEPVMNVLRRFKS